MKKLTVILTCAALTCGLLTGCQGTKKTTSIYADAENWAYAETDVTDKDADVFFITPTVYMGDETQLTWAEYDEDTKESFVGAINMEKGIYDDNARFFAPYYHQAAFSAYTADEAEADAAFDSAYAELKDAFDYYMDNYNEGRPLVLAGFSQGGQMSIRLMEDYAEDETFNQVLVATYAIGWRFTEEEAAQYPDVHFAQGETDTDVLIAFTTEDPAISDSIIIPAGTKSLAINPLNWKTDGTEADSSLNLGACFTGYDGSIKSEIPEFTGAYIDDVRGALKVTDVNAEDYPGRLFEDGIYHLYDYEFFYRNLEQNVQDRIESYLSAR